MRKTISHSERKAALAKYGGACYFCGEEIGFGVPATYECFYPAGELEMLPTSYVPPEGKKRACIILMKPDEGVHADNLRSICKGCNSRWVTARRDIEAMRLQIMASALHVSRTALQQAIALGAKPRLKYHYFSFERAITG